MDVEFHVGQLVMVKEDPDVFPFCGEIARVYVLKFRAWTGLEWRWSVITWAGSRAPMSSLSQFLKSRRGTDGRHREAGAGAAG